MFTYFSKTWSLFLDGVLSDYLYCFLVTNIQKSNINSELAVAWICQCAIGRGKNHLPVSDLRNLIKEVWMILVIELDMLETKCGSSQPLFQGSNVSLFPSFSWRSINCLHLYHFNRTPHSESNPNEKSGSPTFHQPSLNLLKNVLKPHL